MITIDETLKRELKGFDKLWTRVHTEPEDTVESVPGCSCQTEGLVPMLMEFMDDEAMTCAFYKALAGRFTGPCRAALLKTAAEEKAHFKKLQVEYFLLTGDSYTPKKHTIDIDGPVSALRQAWLGEQKSAAGYMSASLDAKSSRLRDMFGDLSADETRHIEIMHRLIGLTLE